MLVDIIMANKWSHIEGKMKVKEQERYSMMCGDKYLRYENKALG